MPSYTTNKCGEMDLYFFLATLLFIVLSVDFLKRSDLLSHVARKFIICTPMEQKCRIIITRVSAQSYQPYI